MHWLTLKLVSFIFKLSVFCGIYALKSKIVQFLQSCEPRSLLVVPRLTLLNVGRVELYPCQVLLQVDYRKVWTG